jgi:hydroxyacylglutathione hydrolase
VKIDVLHSGIWQLSSTLLSDGDEVLAVDPGYFPRELDDLARLAATRGRVTRVVFTHGHWDHVIGWRTFPEAEVASSPTLAAAVAEGGTLARENLARAAEFDGQWYVDRGAPPAWPPRVRPLTEGEVLTVGSSRVRAILLPGHSPDGIGLLTYDGDQPRTLLVGDYLSPCEIPFVDRVEDYRATLRRLLGLLPELEAVIPGHGPRLTPAQAIAIAEADLDYLDALARGEDPALPRAADVPGMRAHHSENLAICCPPSSPSSSAASPS